MRIISGTWKGKRLIAPKKLPVRPTTDFAKEGLFNILRNRFDLDQLSVLDLFAGTGNISYEFGSRGVQEVTAVDAHAGCVAFIRKTAEQLELPIRTIKSDVFAFLEKSSGSYDLVFADPPYALEVADFEKLVSLVLEGSMLEENGTLIVEHGKHTNLSHLAGFIESRKYGGSVFSFFE